MRYIRLVCILSVFVVLIVFYVLLHQNVLPTGRLSNAAAPKFIQHGSSRSVLYVAVVACGQRLQETLVMIKSALMFSYPKKDLLHFIVFAEDHLITSFQEKLGDWRDVLSNFDFDLLPLRFPPHNEAEWRGLFKPCASQRLFLPSLLQTVDSLLYVDTDILFLSPVSDVWRHFEHFNASQIAALTPEHEDENIGWYNRFARHPYYGRMGVNSGVMLMNLTRMRQFDWESHILPIYKEYKLRITWGDQDIINILFYYHSEKLFLMPCEFNYRPDHCMYMAVCNASAEGIKLMHGNRGYFHSNKQPLFKAVYEAVESFSLGSDPHSNFLLPLQEALNDRSISESNCGKVANETLQVARKIFVIKYNYDT